jgi:glycosyltransferase involved in cell wall biosynthesis
MNTIFTNIKDKLTIVIPSKNEGRTLYDCIYNISYQYNVAGTRVIIADISDDALSLDFIRRIKIDFKYSLDIEVIKGGYPAYGRYQGGKMVTTPYVLFLDADVFLTDRNVLMNTLSKTKHLTSVTFSTDHGFNWIYKIFTFTQRIMKFFGSSFAIGGFQLFKTDAYRYAGEYVPEQVFAEDYYISNKIWSPLYTIHKTNGVYTSARRFKNKGLFYMISLMIKCWFNRNNPNFYLKSHGYWN